MRVALLCLLAILLGACGAKAQTYGQVIWGQQQNTSTPNIVIFDGTTNVVMGQLNTVTHGFTFPPGTAINSLGSQPPNLFFMSPNAVAGNLAARTPVSADFPPGLAFVNPTGTTTATTDTSAALVTAAWVRNLGLQRTLQSFGAKGDGVADDTSALSAAFNSGQPLSCNGSFNISSLVTITNVSFWMSGAIDGCILIYNNSTSMIYATLTAPNKFVMRNVKIKVNVPIASVPGPAHTAAVFVTYPAGTINSVDPNVDISDIRIFGSASGNYILNGIYLNDASTARIARVEFTSEQDQFNISTSGIVIDGTHTPTDTAIDTVTCVNCGNGVSMPLQSGAAWQDVRVNGLDCDFCDIGVNAIGGADGMTDGLIVTNSTGSVQNAGVFVSNVGHANITTNYISLANMNIPHGTTYAFPVCYQYVYTLVMTSSGAISNNSCSGSAVTGYTSRYGWGVTGTGRNNLATHIGTNQLTTLDFGGSLAAATAGVLVEHQSMSGVTTEVQDASTAGDNLFVPPLAVVNGTTPACGSGIVGEVCRSVVLAGSAVSLVSGVGKDMTTLVLTKGHWTCYGETTFNIGTTAAATLQNSISLTANTPNLVPPTSYMQLAATFTASSTDAIPFNTVTFDFTAASTTIHAEASSIFTPGTNAVYGFVECQRTE